MRMYLARSTPSCFLLLFSYLVFGKPCPAQILNVAELNAEQIRALDRAKTAVILVGGMMEEHGPYLPAYTDGFLSERMAEDLARAIAARPGWKAVIFPVIPLGAVGSNEIGRHYSYPGTYAVRPGTLRAVFMDVATELGEQGFRWIFVAHVHGAQLHNRALDEAGDYFHDTYGGRMVHLWGLVPVISAWGNVLQGLSHAEKKEEGVSLHAGMDETSLMLYLQPKLVAAGWETAKVHTGQTLQESFELAKAKDWPEYFGSPRLASAALGEKIWQALSGAAVAQTLKVLDGEDPAKVQQYADLLGRVPLYAEMEKASRTHEMEVEWKQREWLKKRHTVRPPPPPPLAPLDANNPHCLVFLMPAAIEKDFWERGGDVFANCGGLDQIQLTQWGDVSSWAIDVAKKQLLVIRSGFSDSQASTLTTVSLESWEIEKSRPISDTAKLVPTCGTVMVVDRLLDSMTDASSGSKFEAEGGVSAARCDSDRKTIAHEGKAISLSRRALFVGGEKLSDEVLRFDVSSNGRFVAYSYPGSMCIYDKISGTKDCLDDISQFGRLFAADDGRVFTSEETGQACPLTLRLTTQPRPKQWPCHVLIEWEAGRRPHWVQFLATDPQVLPTEIGRLITRRFSLPPPAK